MTTKKTTGTNSDALLTMQGAMDFLTSKGFPCKARHTFYRLLEDFKIPYVDMNPESRYKMRRFAKSSLEAFVAKKTKGRL